MNDSTSTIRAVAVVAAVAIVGVVCIVIFVPGDSTVLIGLIFAAAAPTIAGLLGLAKSAQNSADIADTQAKVNSLAITVDGRLTQLLEAKIEAAHAVGVLSGTQDERDRVAGVPVAPPPPVKVPTATPPPPFAPAADVSPIDEIPTIEAPVVVLLPKGPTP